MTQVTVSKLAKPYKDGDWKDPPFKWTVRGPANEVQNFCTKKHAMLYAKLRRQHSTQRESCNAYVRYV